MAQGIKTGGRTKGTPNRVTGSLREMILKSISNELQSLPILLNQLEPKEKIDALLKLLPYLIPKAETAVEPESKKATHSEFVQNFINQMQ